MWRIAFVVVCVGFLCASIASAEVLGPKPEEPTVGSPGGPVKVDQVEVVNFPPVQQVAGTVSVDNLPAVQDVYVVNPTAGAARWQLVGYTEAATAPNIGVFGMTRLCQAEFPGSRFCTRSDILATTSIPTVTGAAWLDPGDGGYNSCDGWRTTSGGFLGLVIDEVGGLFNREPCDQGRHVACCVPVAD